MWTAITTHPWQALAWALVVLFLGMVAGNALAEFKTNPTLVEVRRLRARMRRYLRLTAPYHLPGTEEDVAAKELEAECDSFGL